MPPRRSPISPAKKIKFSDGFPTKLVVWARVDNFPWWPSVIIDRATTEKDMDPGELPPATSTNRLVEFFNDDNHIAVVDFKDLLEYTTNIHKVKRAGVDLNSVLVACTEASNFINTTGLTEQRKSLADNPYTMPKQLPPAAAKPTPAEEPSPQTATPRKEKAGRKKRERSPSPRGRPGSRVEKVADAGSIKRASSSDSSYAPTPGSGTAASKPGTVASKPETSETPWNVAVEKEAGVMTIKQTSSEPWSIKIVRETGEVTIKQASSKPWSIAVGTNSCRVTVNTDPVEETVEKGRPVERQRKKPRKVAVASPAASPPAKKATRRHSSMPRTPRKGRGEESNGYQKRKRVEEESRTYSCSQSE